MFKLNINPLLDQISNCAGQKRHQGWCEQAHKQIGSGRRLPCDASEAPL